LIGSSFDPSLEGLKRAVGEMSVQIREMSRNFYSGSAFEYNGAVRASDPANAFEMEVL
jgi:hypothetical protein